LDSGLGSLENLHRLLIGNEGASRSEADMPLSERGELLFDLRMALRQVPPGITSVKVVEIRGRSAVAIGQAAWGGTSEGGLGVASPSISGGASSAIASTCM
jgi:hypothetical protein